MPNPFSQLLLSRKCEVEWNHLEAHFEKSTISLSRPVEDATRYRAVRPRKRLNELVQERAKRMNRARYILSSDISEFYGSIYTHSFEWALHGKTASKHRIASKSPKTNLGDQLDRALRAAQDGQTKGIPMGPDTSLILSEIVMCAVDEKLQSDHYAIQRSCTRFIDDLEYFASTQHEAEDVLQSWQSALATYELTVNQRKTKIVEGPTSVELTWRTTLVQFQIRSDMDRKAANDIYSFFSTAFELARANREQPVLAYAVSKAGAEVKGKLSAEAFQQLALAAAIVDPSCLRQVARALSEVARRGLKVERIRLGESLNDICEYHARREHGSEVTWALWMLRRYGLTLEQPAAESVASMQDNCSLLLLFDLIRLGRTAVDPDMSQAVARAEAVDAWRSEDWLLAYECSRNRWAGDRAMRAGPHWKELLDLDIEFFKLGAASQAPSSKRPAVTPPVAPADEDEQEGDGDGEDAEAAEDEQLVIQPPEQGPY